MTASQRSEAPLPRKRGAWRHPYETPRPRPLNGSGIPRYYLGYPPNPLGRDQIRMARKLTGNLANDYYHHGGN